MPFRDAAAARSSADDEIIMPLSIDTAPATWSQRPASVHKQDAGEAKVELESIMATASNPVSPGLSSPPLHRIRPAAFEPPARPSSTPFPKPDLRTDDLRCLCPGNIFYSLGEDDDAELDPSFTLEDESRDTRLNLNDLPAEIHECILDHLFGYRISTASKSSVGMQCVTKSWSTALRHSRRRELSQLALVSSVWRVLIQERLFRHIKLKATGESLSEALVFFAQHRHMQSYVKHVEVWFPVFQARTAALSSAATLPTMTPEGTSATYTLPADNCSLEETFYLVSTTFPSVRVLTLEGGERKKAPKVRHFAPRCGEEAYPRAMPRIDSVRTLVCKGQWNLMRSAADFDAVVSALPRLEEWHGSYSKPKSKSYLCMAAVLPSLPLLNLTSLHLCLESDYRREVCFPPYFLKVARATHFCLRLAECAPALEHLSYTGRVCRGFFDVAARLSEPRTTRLKSVDLVVKNCCRGGGGGAALQQAQQQQQHQVPWGETGSGITDMSFIAAFEALVMAGVGALERLKALEYLRIRYVDLDSPVPPLNPYFLLRDGLCSGVWSDGLVAELARVRPAARFEDVSETFGAVTYKDGRMYITPDFPRRRVLSLKLANYALLAGGVHAHAAG